MNKATVQAPAWALVSSWAYLFKENPVSRSHGSAS